MIESENLKDYKIIWPFPKQARQIDGIKTYYYNGKVSIPLYLQASDQNKPTKIKLEIDYALCADQCIIKKQLIEKTIPATKYNIQLSEFKISNVNYDEGILNFTAHFPKAVHNPSFLVNPLEHDFITDIGVSAQNTNGYNVSMKINSQKLNENNQNEYHIYSNKAELPTVITIESTVQYHWILSLGLFAIIGGFILNFMPCVLPVLSLKILAFVKNPDINRKTACISTIAGIITSFWVLAIITILLKNSGRQFGLGINFQYSEFIIVLTLIITAFISGAIGAINFSLPDRISNYLSNLKFNNQYLEHYFSGILVTILSTPCNAPFLGTAMALSLASSSSMIFFTFSFVAIGLIPNLNFE